LAKGVGLKIDLLRRRREQFGLEVPTPLLARSLRWRGSLIGGGLVLAVLFACLAVFFNLRWLEDRQIQLAPAVADYEKTQTQIIKASHELQSLQKGNEALAEGIAGLRSGSALLTELSRLTPRTVQLTKLRVLPNSLELSGVTNQPRGLSVVNAYQLRLDGSPFFQSDGVILEQAVEIPGKTSSLKPKASADSLFNVLDFDLTAAFAADAAKKLTSKYLQSLGSRGLAERLDFVNHEGLLP